MREIKFRGKSIYTGEWLYGDILIHGETAQIWVNTDDGKWNYIVDPETVGQYTGLHDKNGVEIYDGDIVACGDGEVPTLIEWHDESHSYLAYNLKRKEYHGLDKYFIRFIGEVIGNIHDQGEAHNE